MPGQEDEPEGHPASSLSSGIDRRTSEDHRAGYASGLIGLALGLTGTVATLASLVAPWWLVLLATIAALFLFVCIFLMFGLGMLAAFYRSEQQLKGRLERTSSTLAASKATPWCSAILH
jgi:hypothetical protein